jgi:DNA repair exonuclease SbcCD ATPase subunit
MPQQIDNKSVSVSVQNLGGIDTCNVEFGPDVTILTGHNATNRTSLLTAVASVLGGSTGTLKGDADRGEVTLELDGDTYTRRFIRENSGVRVEGEPYTTDETLVDLFACLLETNPARQAVERGDDLRELVMRPVDIDELQTQIRELEDERRELEERLSTIERQRDRLPDLEQRRTTLEEELEDVEEQLSARRQEIEAHEADREEASAAQDVVETHQETQAKLSDARQELETQQTSLEALRDERDEVEAELEEVDGDVSGEVQELETELERLRERKRVLADAISDLSAIVEFNEELLEGGTKTDELLGRTESDDVTAQLDPTSETIECWTCGSDVKRQEIAERVDEFRHVIEERRADRKAAQERIEELSDRQAELETLSTKRERLEHRRQEIEAEIQDRQDRIAELQEREANLKEQVTQLEQEIAETEDLRDSDLLEKYQTVSELEYERGQVEQELTDVRDELQQIEELADERDQLEVQRDELQTELSSLRTRVEDLEREVVEIFNDRMADILELLEYENLERIWIERKTDGSGSGTGIPDSSFDLHVVRTTEDGSVYEDTVDHLSESEREVTGLIVALAGYVAHDVYETVPMILLDSVEAIDASRIARLVKYIAETVPYLIVALLPEDAAALDDEYARLSADDLQT